MPRTPDPSADDPAVRRWRPESALVLREVAPDGLSERVRSDLFFEAPRRTL